MSELGTWVAGRRPQPPSDLQETLRQDVSGGDVVTEPLLEAACERLDAAIARPERLRESAFDLLAADALVTYACEAALESKEPMGALERLFTVGEVR